MVKLHIVWPFSSFIKNRVENKHSERQIVSIFRTQMKFYFDYIYSRNGQTTSRKINVVFQSLNIALLNSISF